jgi:small subunit ribosomal protein S20
VANHPSAEKRARQNKKRRTANVRIKSTMKTALKKAREAVTGGAGDAATLAREAEAALSKAASRGVVSKRRVSRKVSRLMKALGRAKA